MGCGGSLPNSVMDEIREIEHSSNVELYDQRSKPQNNNFQSNKRSSICFEDLSRDIKRYNW